MKSKRVERQMNKEQSARWSSVDRSCKYMCTISMSYPDVVIACIEHKVSEAFRAIEAALVKHDNNMKDYSLVVDWSPQLANHSNYLVMTEPTQSVTYRENGKLQLKYIALIIKWIYNIVYSEGRTRDVHSSSLLIDVYALFSDVSLRQQASMTQAEKFPDPFCSRAVLICSIILVRKADIWVVVLRVLFFVDMRLPRIDVADLYYLKLFLRSRLLQIN